jgi:DNA-binding GntR family transcriptional regulator
MSARLMELAWNADTPEDLPRQSCRWVLTHMASLAFEDGRALADIDEVAKKTGLGPMQVEAALFRLKQNGLISYSWADGAKLRVQLHLEPAA